MEIVFLDHSSKISKQADTLGEIIRGHWEQGNGADGNRLECLFYLNVYFFSKSDVFIAQSNTLILRNQVSAIELTNRLGIHKNLLNKYV